MVIVVSIFLTYFSARSLLGNRECNPRSHRRGFHHTCRCNSFHQSWDFSKHIVGRACSCDAMAHSILHERTEPSLRANVDIPCPRRIVRALDFPNVPCCALGRPSSIPNFYRRYFKNYFKSVLFTTAGLFCLFVLLGSFLSASLERIFTGYVASSFSPTPVPLLLQVLVWNYVALAGPLATVSIIAAVVFVVVKQRKAIWPIFGCIWFGLLVVAAFIAPEGWRFILLSLVPASFLLGDSLGSLGKLRTLSACGSRLTARRMLLPILLCGLILSGSFVGLLPRVFDPSSRSREEAVVDSMSWLKQNGVGRSVASVELSLDYRYLTTLTGLAYVGDFNESANSMVVQTGGAKFGYVAIAVQGTQFPTFESSNMCCGEISKQCRSNIRTVNLT